MTTADMQLNREIQRFVADPLGYVMFVFPWDTNPSIQMVPLAPEYRERFPGCEWGPDKWACEFLDDLGAQIKARAFNGRTSVDPVRFTTSSGHGIGKSVMVSWLIMFIMDTRPWSMGVVTANTSDQLRTKTWAELAKWHGMSLTKHWWQYNSGRGSMSYSRRGSKAVSQKWRTDAQTCREENAEAFQGLHAANATPFYIFDEASGIPDKIWEARFGGATDGEPMSFDFGNPTRKSGYFFENCVGKFRHRYDVRQIDSRSVSITNKALMEEWAQDWGEDSDLFKVKVKGQFPAAGSVQFLGDDLVDEAMWRPVMNDKKAPLIIGVDVARFGMNNTVLYPRIGDDARSYPYKLYNGLDNVQVAEKVIEMVLGFKKLGKPVSGLFIDGGGLGSGPVDILRRLGYNPLDVRFDHASPDSNYRRLGDLMWGRIRDNLPRLALPRDDKLRQQLTQREYGFTQTGAKIQLETKKDMKDRLGPDAELDIADGLSLTYASTPVNVEDELFMGGQMQFTKHEYDPLEG